MTFRPLFPNSRENQKNCLGKLMTELSELTRTFLRKKASVAAWRLCSNVSDVKIRKGGPEGANGERMKLRRGSERLGAYTAFGQSEVFHLAGKWNMPSNSSVG